MSNSSYEAVVIGAGPGGYVAAVRCAQLGLKTAIIEKDDRLGGTCLLRGCIPTKALLESAHLLDKMGSAKRFGISVSDVSLDFAGVQKYRERMVKTNSKGVDYLMRKNEIEVIHGRGKLLGGGKIEVETEDGAKEIQADAIILATGSVCKDMPFIEMDHVRTVNSDDILEIDEVPESLIVMGAGAVGTEFASIYHRFGSDVTLIEYEDRLLPIEDEDISKELGKILSKSGISVMTAHAVQSVELVDGGVKVEVEDREKEETKTLEASMLLVAVGRAPVSDEIGLDSTDAKVDDNGFVEVDEYCQTAEAGLYAIGDVIATPMLAHVASHEGVVAAEKIAGKSPHAINYLHTPNCTYCDPEVASVGLTERAAREQGYDVKVGSFPFSASGKARIQNEGHGLVKFVAETKYEEVLGVHIIGPKATELIAELVVAMHLESTLEEIVASMHPHPTLSEAVGEAAIATLHGAALNF